MNNIPWYVWILPIIVAAISAIAAVISALNARKSADYAAKFYAHNIKLDQAAMGFSYIDFTTVVNDQKQIVGIELKFFFKNIGKMTAVVKLIDCRMILGKSVNAGGKAVSEWPVIGGGVAPFQTQLHLKNPVDNLNQIPNIIYALRVLSHPESEPNILSDRRYHFLFQGSTDIPYLNNDKYKEVADLLPDDFKRK